MEKAIGSRIKGKRKPKSWEKVVAVSAGLVMLSALVMVAIFLSCPTPFQEFVLRVVLAIAAAAFGSTIPGFLEVDVSFATNVAIRAAGALALFVAVLFINPQSLIGSSKGNTSCTKEPGITILDPNHDKTINEEEVYVPILFHSDYTDLNHYFLVTPLKTPDVSHVVRGPISLDGSGQALDQARLGEINLGRGDTFRIETIATQEQLLEGPLPKHHMPFKRSRSIYITRGAKEP